MKRGWWGNRRRAEWRLLIVENSHWVRMEHALCGRSFLVDRLDEAEALSRGHVCPKEL